MAARLRNWLVLLVAADERANGPSKYLSSAVDDDPRRAKSKESPKLAAMADNLVTEAAKAIRRKMIVAKSNYRMDTWWNHWNNTENYLSGMAV